MDLKKNIAQGCPKKWPPHQAQRSQVTRVDPWGCSLNVKVIVFFFVIVFFLVRSCLLIERVICRSNGPYLSVHGLYYAHAHGLFMHTCMAMPWACAWYSHGRVHSIVHAHARGLFTARVYYWQTCPPPLPSTGHSGALYFRTEGFQGGVPYLDNGICKWPTNYTLSVKLSHQSTHYVWI